MDNAFTPTLVCSPALTCLLAGRLSSQHGVHDYLTSGSEVDSYDWLGDEILFPELLAEAGYQTALISKWHLGNDNQPQAGFDYWFAHSARK
jgi:choline-sulfatase